MGRSFGPALALLTLACTVVAAGQPQDTPASKSSAPPSSPPPIVLHTGTRLVVEDIVVEDRSGHPVHGLTRDSFEVTEHKKSQTLRYFEEHSAATSDKTGPELPPLPPGTFTDYTPVVPDSTLNVLLIDALNTPMSDQLFVRQQLLDFVKHEKPGTRVAIFGLNSRLYMLQGFTSDPAVLKDAIEHMGARSSTLLNDPVGSNTNPEKLSEATADAMAAAGHADPETVAAMKQFEAEQDSFQTNMRVQYTIDAFNGIGHYLANFPGRKNLIWFSGSFPLSIMPDSTLSQPFNVMQDSMDEFRETESLLVRARVSVYPVDARGLMTNPAFDASRQSTNFRMHPSDLNNDMSKFYSDQASEHQIMNLIADNTGGKAFFNTNGLSSAVEKALDGGSNYYTFAYTPTDHDWNGAYRKIDVKLTGAAAARGLHLYYRRGYFADDPDRPARHVPPVAKNPALVTHAADHANEAYARAALSRGAPAPQDLLFKVRVVPLSSTADDKISPGNRPDPGGKMKPPFRQYAVDYVAVPAGFTFTPEPGGRHQCEIEVGVLVYDPDGKQLNRSSVQVKLNLTPEMYKTVLASGVRFHLDVTAPAHQQSFLRVLMHDVPTNRYGVVEIPTTEVSRLPPLPAAPAAAWVNLSTKH